MIGACFVWGGATMALLSIGWFLHTQVRGVFPDDLPAGGRKAHGRPIAMAGIVPAACAVTLFAVCGQVNVAVAIALAAAVGLWDDFSKSHPTTENQPDATGLDWRIKAIGLGVASVLAVWAVLADREPSWTTAILAVSFVFVLTNAVNFLDNMNGVAAMVGAAGLIGLASRGPDPLLQCIAAGSAGIWLAFVPWNWPRPRMFLGDAGAYALGLATAALALSVYGATTDVLWPTALPLIDFVQVVSCRLALGIPPWIGDRRHLSHLLHLQLQLPQDGVGPMLGILALWVASV